MLLNHSPDRFLLIIILEKKKKEQPYEISKVSENVKLT
jgi:hypothetical protein